MAKKPHKTKLMFASLLKVMLDVKRSTRQKKTVKGSAEAEMQGEILRKRKIRYPGTDEAKASRRKEINTLP